jgi:hypothetical protein
MTPTLKDILERLDSAIGDWQVGYVSSALTQIIDLRDELLELVGGEDNAPDS